MTTAHPASSLLLADAETRHRVVKLDWAVKFLLCYLIAITVFGKGPTYLIYPPVFWGELVLVSSLIWLVDRHGFLNVFVPVLDYLSVSIMVFALIGLYITTKSVPVYGLEAVRDSALWYYSAFFFVGAYIAKDEDLGDAVWRILRIAWVVALIWGLADILSGAKLGALSPVLPWRGEPVLANSQYEMVEHVGLASLIVLNPWLSKDVLRRWRVYLLPFGVLGVAVALAAHGRGVKLGVLLAIGIMVPMRFSKGEPLEISKKLSTVVVLIALLALLIFVFFGSEVQTVAKLTGVDRFATADPSAPTGTAYFRMIWWKRLVHEVMTRDPVFGLGFGESLNVYNPFLKGNEKTQWPSRAPHNINMTVFSRMGLAGLAVWFFILVTAFGTLYSRLWNGRFRGYRYSKKQREELAFWVMMLAVTWVNSSFGVLMEGPVLGVWFWFALGFAWIRSRPDLVKNRKTENVFWNMEALR